MNILQKLKGSQLTTQYGYMYITTNKQIYLAGEEVNAILYLNIVQSGLLSNGVDININGLEKFKIGGENSTDSYGCQILGLNEQLYKFEDKQVKIGQFEIPFTFALPTIMPGSFTYHIHEKIWVNIKYEIIVQIKGINSGESMQCVHELLVQEPLKSESKEIQFQDIHHPIAYFCVNKGVSSLKYQINKNVFLLNETVFVWIEVDNRMSELDLSKIKISLLNKLILRSTRNQTVVWDNETELNFVVVGGVPAHYQCNGQKKLLAQLILQDTMSDLLKQTAHGMTIQNDYQLKIQVFYSGMKCGNYRINYIPITLLLPFPSANNAPQQPPQDWNPEILQQQRLANAQLNENLEKNPYDIISEQINL